jgi:hypothetical protein
MDYFQHKKQMKKRYENIHITQKLKLTLVAMKDGLFLAIIATNGI